ncbi:DUF7146 domain-containing protein [Jannaschia sp. CCS1]|uniref:DUF7146 domain-containing protein n=1 Tax=Jannaschia sp. (strain CCS1) TaxID=290400 RepID=UPI000053DBAC|nr:toprim domain-containing protein [Jannaschia sp. CCS1]ABD53149.1 virulence-associated protein E [Jannaschia sp. CCS1]
MTNVPIDPRQLTQDLGGKWAQAYGTAPCPICQDRRKGQNALTIRVKGDRLLMHCKKSNCSFIDLLRAAGIAPGTVEIDPTAQREADAARAEYEAYQLHRARKAWDYGKLITGTKGEAYLRGRCITCPLPETLRWIADTYHSPSGQYGAAIVADVQPTGGVHRTFFDKRGNRLAKNAKMMLGPCSGGAVRMSEAVGPLVVCEGIETGLSLLSGLLDGPANVWAALSTSGLRALDLPPRPPSGSLIIATDGDAPGREAGAALADRAHTLGWPVSIMAAPDGQDFNDVLMERRAA